MKRVLEERGVDKAAVMREELRKFEDCNADGVPIVEEIIIGRGHLCSFSLRNEPNRMLLASREEIH